MKLEEWIRKDMTRFIKNYEPQDDKSTPIRHEDYGLAAKIDYEKHIKQALKQGRFQEATKQFNELKEHYNKIPPEHKEEKKHYYRIMQKSYKLIYDWVEDQHKTHRLLTKLDNQQDVFDQRVEPQQIQQENTQQSQSIEQQMTRQAPPTRVVQQAPTPPAQQAPRASTQQNPPKQIVQQAPTPPSQQTQATTKQQPAASAQPKKPKSNDFFKQPAKTQAPMVTQQVQSQPTPQPRATRKDDLMQRLKREAEQELNHESQLPISTSNAELDNEHGPSWEPPQIELPARRTEKPAAAQPQNTEPAPKPKQHLPTKEDVIRAASKEFIKQAAQALEAGNTQLSKQKIIEARFEASRIHEKQLLEHIQTIERAILATTTKPAPKREDVELFSSAYLQGVQAMKSGDYQTAAKLFYKRISQAPRDHAARIRYKECMEALHDQTIR